MTCFYYSTERLILPQKFCPNTLLTPEWKNANMKICYIFNNQSVNGRF